MKILLILLTLLIGPWIVIQGFSLLTKIAIADFQWAGRLGVCLMFLMTGSGHFFLTRPMAAMLPEWVPARVPIVYLTGVLELAASAAVLLFPERTRLIGWSLVVMLALFLPVNIYAAIRKIPIGGHEMGLSYLALRIPAQVFMALWIWWFCVRR